MRSAESPLGHLEARFIFQHAFWDSWLHERDIFVALGSAPPVEADELRAATVFTCFIGAIEGGLMEDPAPVGPLLDRPIDVTLRFDDLAPPLHVQIDKAVCIEPAAEHAGTPAGSALEFVERLAGRATPTLRRPPRRRPRRAPRTRRPNPVSRASLRSE